VKKFAFLVLLTPVAAGCSASKKEIAIGGLSSLTGNTATYGQPAAIGSNSRGHSVLHNAGEIPPDFLLPKHEAIAQLFSDLPMVGGIVYIFP
jgi:hypothetical protein